MTKIVSNWRIQETENVQRAIIALHGKGCDAELMEKFCQLMKIPNTLIVSLEAKNYSWYSSPKSSIDQEDAIKSIPYAINEIKDAINKIKMAWNLEDNQIIIVGHSQGAVLSLLLGIEYSFLAALILAGCVLEPEKILPCNTSTKFFLQHNNNDDCFNFYERYLPTQTALLDNNYCIDECIGDGDHNSFTWDVMRESQKFILNILGANN